MSLRVIRSSVVMVLSASIAIGAGACTDDPEMVTPPPPPPGTNRPPTLGPSPGATIAPNISVTLDLLAGATDPDGDPLTVFSAIPDSSSSLSANIVLQADHRHVLVTPATFSSGEIHIKYTVQDGHNYVNGTAKVIVDRTPQASGDQRTTTQDTPLSLTLQASDPDSDPLTFTVVTPPRNGSLSGTAPNLVYTPAPGFVGSDELSFSVSDGHFTSSVTTVLITVVRLNHAPVATPQSVDAVEDTSVAIPPLAGTDTDGDPLSASVQTAPAHGTLTGATSGLTYVPAANYHGPDSFTFVVSDGQATSARATVSINIASVNDPPFAIAMQRNLNEDTPLALTLLGTDADGDPLSFAIQGPPQHGTLSGTPPNVTYTPVANYNGPDAFTYTASDGVATSAPVTVTLAVAAINDAPVALDGAVTTAEDTPAAITLQATDVDSTGLTFSVLTLPSDGTLTGSGASRTYTPAPNATGVRSLTFLASDGQLNSSTATVTITITPVNDAPVAVDDFVATDPATPLTLDVLHNDTDIDGDSLSIGSATAPAHGGVEIAGGHLVYTPDAGFTGVDSFDYTAEDPAGASSTAHVHVGVGQFPTGAPVEAILALAITTSDSRNAASMSSDGRYLAFTTTLGLVAADTNGVADVYVYDRGTRTLALISQSSSGGTGNGASFNARISADGRYVVFESFANNLVAGDTNSARDVFRRDRLTGDTVRVSVASSGGQASGSSTDPRLSDDGNLVVFASTAFDLVANDANGASDIFVRDLAAGTTTRVSVSTIGGDADLPSTEPSISGDGRIVAFTSAATNLVPGDSNGVSDIFVRDLVAGTTARASVSSTGGQADKASTGASLSRDGRFISFLSSATTLVTGASGTQVYVRDTQAVTTTRPLSATTATWARLSSDGRYLAALTSTGVAICDRFAGVTATPPGASTWLWPSFSGNGRYLVVVTSPGGGNLVAAPNPL